MYHPAGFDTYFVLPNIAPVYIAQQLGMKARNLSAWEATAEQLKQMAAGITL